MTDVSSRFFHPMLPSVALRKQPARVTLAGQDYALFRDHSGRVGALVDRCPHRFAPLSRGRVRADGRLACAYHGWHFDRDGRGASPSQPSLGKCDVAAMQVVERHGYIWMAAPNVPWSAMPSWDVEGYRFCGSFATHFDAPLHVAFDNFSEDEHTPFVHTRLGWLDVDADKIEFSAQNEPDCTRVHYHAPQRPSRVTRLFGLRPGDVFHNDWVTRFDPVHTIYRTHWRDPHTDAKRPPRIMSPIYFVPETATTTWLHTFVFASLDTALGAPLERAFAPLARLLALLEVRDDARFIPTVQHTPFDLKGMRLGKFDKPIVHNHKLLETLYWGREGRRSLDVAGS